MKVVFILGAARSGTTWLAKIFDSHPDVVYRHEPDIVLRHETLPVFVRPEEVPRYETAARAYLDRLVRVRSLKSVGSLPVFFKSHDTKARYVARFAAVYALRGAEFMFGNGGVLRHIPVPGTGIQATEQQTLVLKSVSACGRARLFAKAWPDSRIIFILRDAFGHVASVMRGRALGKFADPLKLDEILQVEQATRHGLTAVRLQAMSEVEQLAWHWAILNEKAMDDLQGLGNVRVILYRDLVDAPAEQARALLAFCGLHWHPQTASFIQQSSCFRGQERYYQVYKDSVAVANRWRAELSAEDQCRIAGVVAATSLAAYFHERQDTASEPLGVTAGAQG